MHYNVTVSYLHDQEHVHLAESPNLAEIKQLAELICRNAEICWSAVDSRRGTTHESCPARASSSPFAKPLLNFGMLPKN